MFGAIYQFLLSLLTQILAFFGISFGNLNSKASSDASDAQDAPLHATASDAPAPPALEPLPMDHADALAPVS